MSIIKDLELKINNLLQNSNYASDYLNLQKSFRPDLSDYQINDAMKLAKKYHDSPQNIAQNICQILKEDGDFQEVSLAGPGFINITLSNSYLIDSMNKINEDIYNNIDKEDPKNIFMDYGGANIAKTLHVGHLRSANIGEAVKRLAQTLGHHVISDVHFGDIGRQSGMVIYEIKRRYPHLSYFDDNYQGDYNDINFEITPEELGEIYPKANILAKQDEQVMQEVVDITNELEKGNKAYSALWNKIKQVSIKDITAIYNTLNTTFDLLEGESDSYKYLDELVKYFKDNNYLEESNNALVIDIKNETDNSPMPPLVVIKSNGGTLYATRELANLYSRIKRFNPDEIWYFADLRQSLYFEQVFRAARKTKIAPDSVNLAFYGFGTMNGKDGKPFKTRDGDVMSLKDLIKIITDETKKRLNPNIVKETEKQKISQELAIAALKYADLIPARETDYIFSPETFTSLEGKTGPYLLYSTIRMKSLLTNANKEGITSYNVSTLNGDSDREICLLLLELPIILTKSLHQKSLNELADYIYYLTSTYNTFYAKHKILSESNMDLKISWLAITNLVYKTNLLILEIFGIDIPEKM